MFGSWFLGVLGCGRGVLLLYRLRRGKGRRGGVSSLWLRGVVGLVSGFK